MSSNDTLFIQLMESMRKQNDLISRWTTTLITVEGGILAAVGIVWNASPAVAETWLKTLVTFALSIVAIATCWACVLAAISDLQWQGRIILAVKNVEPSLFADISMKPKGWGRQAKLWALVGATMTGFWLLAIELAFVKWYRVC
jgi:hypothetical protein